MPFCSSADGWDTEICIFSHCLYIPITESVNEMSICVLFIEFIITHKTGNASHEQPQNNLHYMMTEHKIPANWLKFQTIW